MRDNNYLIKNYGVYTLPYATVWPDLADKLAVLYRDKMRDIPWLPLGWSGYVTGSENGKNGNIAIIAPSTANHPDGAGAYFLDTPEKRAWWDKLANMSSEVLRNYAAKEAAKGKVLIDRAYADAQFWTNAHQWATILGSPVTAIRGAFNNPFATVGGALGIGAVVLVGYLIARKKKLL